jgi:hypothetical protein
MKTEEELNKNILEVTMRIQEFFPELSKFISERPQKIFDPTDPEVDLKSLEYYYNSLVELINKYTLNHEKKKNIKDSKVVTNI